MTTLVIRPMTAADLDNAIQIEEAAHPFPWTRGILADCIKVGYECWVLQEENQLLAYAFMQVAAGESHLLNITVAPAYQRQGHGRKLMQFLLKLAKEKQVEMMLLEVRSSNAAAISLYEDLGFNEIGIRKDYYPTAKGKEDAIMFALDLNVITL